MKFEITVIVMMQYHQNFMNDKIENPLNSEKDIFKKIVHLVIKKEHKMEDF